MNQPFKAKIFLANERGCNETEWFRSHSIFNNKDFFNQFKQPFYDLYFFNEEVLAGGRSLHRKIEKDSIVFLIPVLGSIVIKDQVGKTITIDAGQLFVGHLDAEANFEIINRYETELISFIEIRILSGQLRPENKQRIFDIEINENWDKLQYFKTGESLPVISIGKFNGRKEAIYEKEDLEKSFFFVFVLEGVFEVAGRLLHSKDGLGLWGGNEELEMEALSNDAIILVVEF